MPIMSLSCRFRLAILIVLSCWFSLSRLAQRSDSEVRKADPTWAGQRIVALKGFGDYFVIGDHGEPQLVKPEGLGINIVAVVQRVDADRIWIKANGQGDAPVGWVSASDAILLDGAIPYFTALLKSNPDDWDSYLRRAESEHAR
jgi:hypothetical protein